MATTVTFNGVNYSIPAVNEEGWQALSNYLIALAGAQPSGGGADHNIRVSTNATTTVAVTDYAVLINHAGAATVNLPAGVEGQVFYIGDASGLAGTNNITINRNGGNTILGGTSVVLSTNSGVIGIQFSGGNWYRIAQTFPTSVTGPSSSVNNGLMLWNGTAGNLAKDLGVGSANQVLLTNGTTPSFGQITNAYIDPNAAIAHSKLAPMSGGSVLMGNASNVPTATALSGDITVDSSGVTAISSGVIVNADVNASAAIAYSKLNLAGSIVNADVSASAAIAYSKLALSGSVVNADINASAAIARSKLASGTADHVLINNGSGGMSSEAALATSRGGTGLTTIGSAFQLLRVNVSATGLEFATISGLGDVTGPGSSATNGVVLFASTTGKAIKDGGAPSGVGQLYGAPFGSPQWTNQASSFAFTDTTDQLQLGPTPTGTIINAAAKATLSTYTIPDVGTTADFVMSAGAQTIAGAKTFSSLLTAGAGITVTGGSAANNSLWVASNVLRQRGGTSGWAVDNTSGNAILSATDAGEFSLAPRAAISLSGAADQRLSFLSNSTSGEGFSIVAKSSTLTGNRALSLYSMGQDADQAGDMVFDVRTSANAAFTTTTFDAFRFRHAGTNILTGTRAGAWTLGPAVNLNYNAGPHLFAGNIAVRTPTSPNTDQSGRFEISTNASLGVRGNRYSTTLGGASIALNSRSSNTAACFEVLTNKAGDALDTGVGTILWANQNGAWTLGPASFTSTSGAFATVNGGMYSVTSTSATGSWESAIRKECFAALNNNAAYIAMGKSASNTVGIYAATSNGTILGAILWNGVGSTNNSLASANNAAYISCIQDGAAGTIGVPGRIEFGTSNAGGGSTAKGGISSAGAWTLGPAAGAKIKINGHLEIPRTDVATSGTITNYALGAAGSIKFTSGSAKTLDTVAGDGADGRLLYIINTGGTLTILDNSSAAGLSANRFLTGSGASITITTEGAVTAMYDAGNNKWRVVSIVN